MNKPTRALTTLILATGIAAIVYLTPSFSPAAPGEQKTTAALMTDLPQLEPLKQQFLQDDGEVRLIALLSPT